MDVANSFAVLVNPCLCSAEIVFSFILMYASVVTIALRHVRIGKAPSEADIWFDVVVACGIGLES